MLLRRISQHVKDQNWFAVAIDFVIVVLGVYIGVWAGGFQERKALQVKQAKVVTAFRLDMQHVHNLDIAFQNSIDQGFQEWEAQRAQGELVPPYYFRIPGSDKPPQHIWDSLPPNQLADLFAPGLLNDLGFYYSELDGMGEKYKRYVIFVEDRILPGLKEDPSFFYREDGQRLKPEFEANMDRLRDWLDENERLIEWSGCLVVRLENPLMPADSCIPDLSIPAVQER